MRKLKTKYKDEKMSNTNHFEFKQTEEKSVYPLKANTTTRSQSNKALNQISRWTVN